MPLLSWLSALVFLVHYWVLKPCLNWILAWKHFPCEMSVCSETNTTRRALLVRKYICKIRSLRECEYSNRNWQRLPLLLHFFGLHWCLYRCYQWCRRSLGLLHQLEGLRQRHCFRRPRNLRSWYKITRVEPPSKSKNTDGDADTLNYLSGQPSVFSSSAPLKKKITSSTFTNGFVFSPCTLLRQV